MTILDSSERGEIVRGKSNKPIKINKIGLLGPFGGGNLGDAAIQDSAIANFRGLNPNLEICAFSLNPQDTETRHGIPTYPLDRRANGRDCHWWRGNDNTSWVARLTDFLIRLRKDSGNSLPRKIAIKITSNLLEILAWLRAYRHLKQLDLDFLMVSGGGQLDDYWRGAWGHPFSLLRWCLLAKLTHTRFLIVSVGAAPIDRFLSKLFTRITLSLANYRSYRDEDSKKYIERVVGFKRDDPYYTDLAFSLPIESYKKSLPNPDRLGLVGIGPMSYFNPKSSWPEKNAAIYEEYLYKLADIAVWLKEQNYHLALFPGQTSHDKLAIEDFRQLLEQKGIGSDYIVERSILSLDDLLEQLIDLDFAIASRFHGVLLSVLLKKPTLALSYHPKIDVLMTDLGMDEYCLKIDDFDLKTVKDRFNLIVERRLAIESRLQSKIKEYQSSLAKQYEYLFHHL